MTKLLLKTPPLATAIGFAIGLSVIFYIEFLSGPLTSYFSIVPVLICSLLFTRLLFCIPQEVFPVRFIGFLICGGGYILMSFSWSIGFMLFCGAVWFLLLSIGYESEPAI